MHSFKILIVGALLGFASAFHSTRAFVSTNTRPNALYMHTEDNVFMKKFTKLATSATVASLLIASDPVFADALKDSNAKLAGYGLPPIIFVPPGFSPVTSEYGRGNVKDGYSNSNPILIQFAKPALWVEEKTSINNNGEAGKVSANDYIKGDSAFFFNQKLAGDAKLDESNKKLVQEFILKSLSQKGDPVEGLKVGQVRTGPLGVDGTKYYLVDVTYQLNTEAGFLIGRKGVVALTSVGDYMQGLVAVTTDKRWKTMEPKIRDIADSFRVYKLQSGVFASS